MSPRQIRIDRHVEARVETPGADVLPPADKGRFIVTRTASDEYVFRAAPLRNIALRDCAAGAVFSFGAGLEPQASGRRDGCPAALGQAYRQGRRRHRRFLGTLTGQLPKIEYPILPVRTDETPEPSLAK